MSCLRVKKESKKIAHDLEDGITTLGEKLQELKISLEKALEKDHPLQDLQDVVDEVATSIGETETLVSQVAKGTSELLDLINALSQDVSSVKQITAQTSSDVKTLLSLHGK